MENVKEISDEIDWLGNSCLHNLFAKFEIDLEFLQKVVQEYPHLVKVPNKLGRLPLHYALDRAKVNKEALIILLNQYPEGVVVRDNENYSPWDLVKRWEHNKTIRWLLLSHYPDADQSQYMKLKYGPLGRLAVWASHATNVSHDTEPTFDMTGDGEYDEEGEDEHDEERAYGTIATQISKDGSAKRYLKASGDDDSNNFDNYDEDSRSSFGRLSSQDDRRLSIAEVTEFENILNSGSISVKSRKGYHSMESQSPVTPGNSSSLVDTSPSTPTVSIFSAATNSNNNNSTGNYQSTNNEYYIASNRRLSVSSVRSFQDDDDGDVSEL